ncbi:MAG: EscU/YscU/HrcU family type III secretion system export apparatus switch protein [Actinomycetota bacterium]|nr:EscU/YscU/HrcU family type III secretion system export apparatus switch protein [Actinomycetota bacterium]
MAKDDKTEAPTPKKKKDARKKGQIARTPELVTWLQVLVATFLLEVTVHRSTTALRGVMTQVRDGIAHPDEGAALGLFGDALREAVLATAPLTGAMMAVGVLGHVAQTGGFASLTMLKPKPERVNPLKGVKRLFSPQGLWHGAKSVMKVGALVVVVWAPLRNLTDTLISSGRLELTAVTGAIAATTLRIARDTAAVGLVIAVLDYALQRRRIMQGMKMTKQEVKDEHRQSEGDPHVRGQIRQRQLAIGRNRMIAAVATADVVIVNPTHVAVALRYEQGRGAPRVVAKGKGAVAQRIREEATTHNVPLVRDVPLARTLESSVRIGEEIPTALYDAVARVLAFLTQLRSARSFGGVLQIPQAAA